MPISVPPISIPAFAFICSTATGSEKLLYAVVEKEPPALGWGTTFTISYPYALAASFSIIIALFKCSQHCVAR